MVANSDPTILTQVHLLQDIYNHDKVRQATVLLVSMSHPWSTSAYEPRFTIPWNSDAIHYNAMNPLIFLLLTNENHLPKHKSYS